MCVGMDLGQKVGWGGAKRNRGKKAVVGCIVSKNNLFPILKKKEREGEREEGGKEEGERDEGGREKEDHKD